MNNKTYSLISLGCAKNQVNSEQMIYLLNEAGYELVSDPSIADFTVINTCGFIDSAKKEAIDTIFETASVTNNIIVTGCLSERYKDEIVDELPEVKGFIGVSSYGDIVKAAEAILSNNSYTSFGDDSSVVDELPRVVSTGPSWAYLKIAEGCDNFCAFCAIPYIRGRFRSRKLENLVSEAKDLAAHGVREIIIIAQDITRYGTDIYGEHALAKLIHQISEIDGIEWIRLHYLYPESFTEELIDEIANNNKVVKYLDIPIQHINNNILKRMNRRGTGDDIRCLFKKLRERIPGLVLRTSLIAGLPGEGEAEFNELCDFLKEARIERAGVFPFSPEEGTPAAKMEHCDFEEAERRAEFIMTEIQAPIMDDFCNSFIGKTLKVLCEYEEDGNLYGRTYADSPEIDSQIVFKGECIEGDFTEVLVEHCEDGILYGTEILL